MHGDWRSWAKSSDWELDGDSLWVNVGSRRQKVAVLETADGTLLRSTVARRAVANGVSQPDKRAWQRNRVSELVGFRIDRKGVLVGETPVPADAGKDEWTYLMFNLARAADRFEYVLTGKDEE